MSVRVQKQLHRGFVSGQMLERVWDFATSQEPLVLRKRGSAFLSQPKLTYGIENDLGELPLFRFGFDKKDWDKISPMPAPYLEVCELIGQKFGVQVTHCLANYFANGTEHYLPIHQDQPFHTWREAL